MRELSYPQTVYLYDSTTGEVELFVDGQSVASSTVASTGAVIENTGDSNGNFEVGRLSSNISKECDIFCNNPTNQQTNQHTLCYYVRW